MYMNARNIFRQQVRYALLLLGVLLVCNAHGKTEEKGNLNLTKVYAHRFESNRNELLQVRLDPSGRYLAVVGTHSGEVQIIDWRSEREVSRRKLAELPCAEIKHPEALADWRFVPQTPTALIVRCGSIYLLHIETLEVLQKLTDLSEGLPEIADLTPDGRYLAVVLRFRGENDPESLLLLGRNEKSWKRLAEWSPIARSVPVQSIDAARFVPGRPELAAAYSKGALECGLILYDIEMLQERTRFSLPTVPHYKVPNLRICFPLRNFAFARQRSNLLVSEGNSSAQQLDVEHAGVEFRVFPTGKVVGAKVLKASGPIRSLIFSPDGELAVSATCDDPQDMAKIGRRTCPLFTLWNTWTGEVLYESAIGRAAWARWAHPSFSPDGRFLVILQFDKLEIYEIAGEGARQ